MWEGVERLGHPGTVQYREAIALALVGLIVNMVSALLLRDDHGHGHAHARCSHEHDHNLRAAYLHVAADAVTSLLAIVALLGAQTFHLPWLDPLVGAAGGLLVMWWSVGLLRASSSILLDHQGPSSLQDAVRQALEEDRHHVADLRCWAVAPERYAVAICLRKGISRSVVDHKQALSSDERVMWSVIEVLG